LGQGKIKSPLFSIFFCGTFTHRFSSVEFFKKQSSHEFYHTEPPLGGKHKKIVSGFELGSFEL